MMVALLHTMSLMGVLWTLTSSLRNGREPPVADVRSGYQALDFNHSLGAGAPLQRFRSRITACEDLVSRLAPGTRCSAQKRGVGGFETPA
jgi:hypothetical protein